MTHEEAADVFECMGDDVSYLADYLSSKQIAAIPIAARVLRERAEGEKGVEQACDDFCEQQDENFWCEKHRNIVEKTYHAAFHAGRASLAAENERLRAELETERMRLAACSVAALGYTHPQDEVHSDYRSASLDDVETLRKKHDELRAQLAALVAEYAKEQTTPAQTAAQEITPCKD